MVRFRCVVTIPTVGSQVLFGPYQYLSGIRIDQLAHDQILQHEMGHVALAEHLWSKLYTWYTAQVPACGRSKKKQRTEGACERAERLLRQREYAAWKRISSNSVWGDNPDPSAPTLAERLVWNPPGHPGATLVPDSANGGFWVPRLENPDWVTEAMHRAIDDLVLKPLPADVDECPY